MPICQSAAHSAVLTSNPQFQLVVALVSILTRLGATRMKADKFGEQRSTSSRSRTLPSYALLRPRGTKNNKAVSERWNNFRPVRHCWSGSSRIPIKATQPDALPNALVGLGQTVLIRTTPLSNWSPVYFRSLLTPESRSLTSKGAKVTSVTSSLDYIEQKHTFRSPSRNA